MTEVWEKFEDFGDQASAEALAGRLRLDGVPAHIERISPLPGLDDRFRLTVPEHLVNRARAILASTDMTELAYVATGKLSGDDDSQAETSTRGRAPFFGGDHLLGLLAGVWIGAAIGLFVLEPPAGTIVGAIVGGIFGELLGLIAGYWRTRLRRL